MATRWLSRRAVRQRSRPSSGAGSDGARDAVARLGPPGILPPLDLRPPELALRNGPASADHRTPLRWPGCPPAEVLAGSPSADSRRSWQADQQRRRARFSAPAVCPVRYGGMPYLEGAPSGQAAEASPWGGIVRSHGRRTVRAVYLSGDQRRCECFETPTVGRPPGKGNQHRGR